MTDCCFSLCVVWFGNVFPSFLPTRFQPCLSSVSWANRQRQGLRCAWTTSNMHQMLQPEDCKELRCSARLCHCLSSKKRKKKKKNGCKMSCAAYMGGIRQVGSGVSQQPQFCLLFVSILFCSASSKLGVRGSETMRMRVDVKWQISSLICNLFY